MIIQEGGSHARFRSADGLTVVGVFLAEANHTLLRENKQRVAVHIDVVELAEMEQRTIDASAMAKSIGETGSVKLDNVYFDFGAATLTAESDAAITEMATLLKDNPGLEIYVVGHTDSVGACQANLDLSRRRAEAVVNALVSRHGIHSAAVMPAGVGPLAPIARPATPPKPGVLRIDELSSLRAKHGFRTEPCDPRKR